MSRHLPLNLVRVVTALSLILTMLSSASIAVAEEPVAQPQVTESASPDATESVSAPETVTAQVVSTGCADDAQESTADNSRGEVEADDPTPLPVDETRAFCTDTDEDWYKLTLTVGDTYAFTTTATSNTRSYMELHDSAGSRVTYNHNQDSVNTLTYIPTFDWTGNQPTGTFYLRVAKHSYFAWGSDQTYTMSLARMDVCADADFEQEGDETRSDPRSVTLPVSETRAFCTNTDADWYELTLTVGDTYTFTATSTSDTRMLIDLYDSNGSRVTYNHGQDTVNTLTYIPTFDWTSNQRTATFYVMVGRHGHYPWGSDQTYTMSLGRTTVCADADLEQEGDDSRSDPRTVSLPLTETRAFCTNTDADWYELTLTVGDTYTFTATSTSDTRMLIDLYDSNGSRVTYNHGQDTVNTLTYIPTFDWTSNQRTATFYVMVGRHGHYPWGSDQTYTMSLGRTTVCADADLEQEGDDSRSDPRTVSLPLTETRAFCTNTDADWYELTLTVGDTYTFTATSTSDTRAYIELYDSNGSRVTYNHGQDTVNTLTYIPTFDWTSNQRTATFYVMVGRHGHYPWGSDQTYTMSLETTTVCADKTSEFAGNGDNNRTDAPLISPHTTVTRAFCTNTDADWLAVQMVAGNAYTFTATMTSSTRAYLQIQDVYGNGWANNYGQDTEQSVSFTPSSSGTYYLHVGRHTYEPWGSDKTFTITTSVIEPNPIAPTVTWSPSTAANTDGWFKRNVTISMAAADTADGSGLESWSWSVSGAQTQALTTQTGDSATASYTVSADGVTTITWTATDFAQNTDTGTIVVQMDKTGPQAAATLNPAPSSSGWNAGNVTVNLSATDAGSGVRRLTYQATGAQSIAQTNVTGATTSLSITTPGTTTITVFATDIAGNVGATTTVVVKIDTDNPVADAAVNSPPVSGDWRKGPVSVTINAMDASSGVASITYSATGAQVIGSTTVSGATATFPITATGVTTITYTATDNAGRTSAPQTLTLSVDGSKPVATAPVVRIAFPTVIDPTTSATRLRLTWTGSDAADGSGLRKFLLNQSSDGGASWSSISPLPSDTATTITRSFVPGTYQFRVRTVDNVGNFGDWMVSDPVTIVPTDQTAATATGSWSSVTSIPNSFGGDVLQSSTTGDTVTFSFTGKSVALVAGTSRFSGIAEIYVDGKTTPTRTVDLYATKLKAGRVMTVLSFNQAGPHTITIRVSGNKNTASKGTRIDIDGFIVTQ